MQTIVETVDLPSLGKKHQGKVRDWYVKDNILILITTDRISAFDRILGYIPYKGQVLNQLAAFWFKKTQDIIPNHIISIPDPNVAITKKCDPILVEMVVRGYMTGVTVTAIWPSYQRGERTIYGVPFPDGLKKNQKLPRPIITPTYHGDITGKGGHDTRLTKQEIIDKKLISQKIYEQMEQAVLALFQRGTDICEKAGIILVDTKYEFGLINGKLVLMDEIHTPDSSRFWVKETYQKRFDNGEEPENYDKEFLRLWLKKQGYSGDGKPPTLDEDITKKLSNRYREVYEKITGEKFLIDESIPVEKRIKQNVQKYFST